MKSRRKGNTSEYLNKHFNERVSALLYLYLKQR